MKKILTINKALSLSKQLHLENKKIVLAGGCFDVLHIGHIQLLQKAKGQGNFLFVMLESDQRMRLSKGKDRPIHSQRQRAELLAALQDVDGVILLPFFKKDKEYDTFVLELHPNIIATTKGDPMLMHKNRQAKILGSKVIFVNKPIHTISTSTILSKLLADTRI